MTYFRIGFLIGIVIVILMAGQVNDSRPSATYALDVDEYLGGK